jgi:hypothetical protein
VNGVNSGGLTTTVFPAASAGGSFIVSDVSGPFPVMMAVPPEPAASRSPPIRRCTCGRVLS